MTSSLLTSAGPGARRLALTAMVVLLPKPGGAALPVAAPRALSAYACGDDCGVKIDAVLDDALWKDASRSDHFVQMRPHEFEPATEPTEIQVGFDHSNVYIAVYAHDSIPAAIRKVLNRRDDEPPSDWIRIAFDSYADRRTAFEFSVNPAGVQVDALWSDDTNRDVNWDAVWEVATLTTSDGWIAEYRIPLSQLRFSSEATADWGFQARRDIERKNEISLWSPQAQADRRVVSRFGTLTGLRDLAGTHGAQLVPYALLDVTWPDAGGSGTTWRRGPFGIRAGADAKLAVSSNLTLGATLNPDFGQVEADPSELNLSAFETFFPEKRPFFLEGNEILRFGLGFGDGDVGLDTLYYSRRIGRAPQRAPDVPSDATLTMPTETQIYGAAKLSGKTASGLSLAVLDAVTSPESATIALDGQRRRELVEPLTNYLVARSRQDLRDGRTSVGAMVTSVSRHEPFRSAVPFAAQATTGGLDLSHRWHNDEYELDLTMVGSDVRGSAAAIDEIQTSSARYLQRPDRRYFRYDPTRTSLSGAGGSVVAGKFGGEPWRFGVFALARSPGFEANDIGYLRFADAALAALWVGYYDFQPGKLLRFFCINTNAWYDSTLGNEPKGLGGNLNAQVELLNYWQLYAGLGGNLSALNVTLLRGGPAFREPQGYQLWFGGSTDARQWLAATLDGDWSADAGGSSSLGIRPGITLRPAPQLRVSTALSYRDAVDDRQYVDAVEEQGSTHYVVGHLHRLTWALVTRVDYTVSPTLSVQFYGQPFVSAGHYTSYRDAAAPRARRYQDRFVPFAYGDSADFNFKQFRSNLVVRWQYRPGSAVFLVWAHERTDEEAQGRFRPGRDLSTLFNAQAENIVLVKLNIWLDA